MAKSGSSTVQYNLRNVSNQTMRLRKKKKKSAAHLQFKASKWLESPLCFFVLPLSFKFLSLRYVDDSDFFLCHALNCKLWKHEKKSLRNKGKYQLNVDNNLGFHKFSFIFLCDWSRQIVPLSQPIRCKARTDHHLDTVAFLHFRQYCCFTLIFHWLREIYSLNVIGRCACAGFGFTPLTTQMRSLQNSYNTTSHVRSLRIFQFLFKLCLLLNSLFLNTFLSFVSFKKPYLVSSFIHISFSIHLNSSPWVPSLDKVFLRKLKTKQNKNNL